MSNIHRFKPRPKALPPRRRLSWARAGWLPWVLVLAAAVVLAFVGAGGGATAIAAIVVMLVGAWLEQRA